MSIQISLERANKECRYVPLAVVGYCLTRSGVLPTLWSDIEVNMKTRDHSPHEKLQDVLVAIMAGCRSLAQVNIRLGPETALAMAWHRATFADQSSLSRLLDALQTEQIDQLRLGNLNLLKQFSQVRDHPRRQPLLVDVDATSLLASKHAEGSRKGWVSGKKTNTADMSCASPWRAITKISCRSPIRATATPTSTSNRRSRRCSRSGRFGGWPMTGSFCAVMPNWAPMRMCATCSGNTSRC